MAVNFKHLRMRLFFCCIITFTSFYSFANEISFELKNEEIIDIPISIVKIIKTIDVMINDLGGYERLEAEEPIKLLLETSNENFKIILGILLRNKDIIESNLSIDTSGLDLTDALKNSLISFDSKTLLDLLVITDFLDIEILKIAITEHWLDNFSAQMTDVHNISSDLKETIIRRISSCKFMEIMWKNDNSIEERHNTKEEETYQIALKIYYDKIVPSSTAKKTCMEIYLNHLVAQYISLYASGYSWLPYCPASKESIPYLKKCQTKKCCDKDYIVNLFSPLMSGKNTVNHNAYIAGIISSLFNASKDKKSSVREPVIDLFASIGPVSKMIEEVLSAALYDANDKVRFAATKALITIKPIEVQVSLVNGMFNHCYSHNCEFSEYAFQELQKLDKLHYKVKVVLVEAMKYNASYENARDILEKFITDPEVIQLLMKSLKDESSFLRRNAIKMLASRALDNKDIKKALSKNLKDKEAKARLAAIDFFLTVSPLKTHLPLIELLKESCFADRNQAYQRLFTLEKLDKKAEHALVEVAKHANAATFASDLLEKFFPQSSQNNYFWFF